MQYLPDFLEVCRVRGLLKGEETRLSPTAPSKTNKSPFLDLFVAVVGGFG